MHNIDYSASSDDSTGASVNPVQEVGREEGRSPRVDHKKNIAFRIPSLQRRNVDKYIVRTYLGYFENNSREIQDLFHLYGLSEEEYEEIKPSLQQMQKDERVRTGAARKDYASLINLFISLPKLRLILTSCLRHQLEILSKGRAQRIKPGNSDVYQITIEDILSYLHSLDSFTN
jgi:hypothetical protein